MAKLFVVQDRYNEEITQWHIFSNAAKAQNKFDELEAEYKADYDDEDDYEDWRVELEEVSGPHCGFLIGFDDWEGKVFADPVEDVRGYELDDSIYGQTTAYLIGPKTKEGNIIVGTYGELDFPTGNVQQLAYWEASELEDDNIPPKPTKKGNETLKFFYIYPTWPRDQKTVDLDTELTWYIYTNEAKAKKKHKELLTKFGNGRWSEYWGRDYGTVKGTNCGVLGSIQPKSIVPVDAKSLDDIASDIKEYWADDVIKDNAGAFIVRPKSSNAEGTVVWSGGKFNVSKDLEEVAIWKNSKLIKGSIPENAQTVDGLKYVQLYEGFVKNLKK